MTDTYSWQQNTKKWGEAFCLGVQFESLNSFSCNLFLLTFWLAYIHCTKTLDLTVTFSYMYVLYFYHIHLPTPSHTSPLIKRLLNKEKWKAGFTVKKKGRETDNFSKRSSMTKRQLHLTMSPSPIVITHSKPNHCLPKMVQTHMKYRCIHGFRVCFLFSLDVFFSRR